MSANQLPGLKNAPRTSKIDPGPPKLPQIRIPTLQKLYKINANCLLSAVVHAHHTEVIASRSELLSLHCPRHLLLLALLPACAGSQVIMRQDCSAYAEEPLRTVGLLEAAHQYSLQDVCRSASTPIPPVLPIQE